MVVVDKLEGEKWKEIFEFKKPSTLARFNMKKQKFDVFMLVYTIKFNQRCHQLYSSSLLIGLRSCLRNIISRSRAFPCLIIAPTYFFIFFDEFSKSFEVYHSEAKSVAMVGKAQGEKWKEMSESKNSFYIDNVQQKKQKYSKSMWVYIIQTNRRVIYCLLHVFLDVF